MLSINPPTAHLLLEEYVKLRANDWIAINAANSAIARWLIGLGKRKGLKILGLVRRAEVLDEVRAAGCDVALLDNDDAPAKVAEALRGLRPRLALDAISGEASGRLAKLLGHGGTFVSYAAPSFAPLSISPFDLIFNDLIVRGFSLGNPAFAEQIPPAIREAARMIAIQEITVPTTAIYPLGRDQGRRRSAHYGGGKNIIEGWGCQ